MYYVRRDFISKTIKISWVLKMMMFYHLKQGAANFSIKDQIVNIFDVAGHMVSSQLLSSATVAGKQP